MTPSIHGQTLDDHACESLNGGGPLVVSNRFDIAVGTNVATPTQVGIQVFSPSAVLKQISFTRQVTVA